MRRLILAILISLSLCGSSYAFLQSDPGSGGNPAPACGSVGSHEDGTTVSTLGVATGTIHYVAGSFTTTAAGTIHEVQVQLRDAASPTEVIQLALCTSDGGTPPAPTGTCTNADETFSGTTGAFAWFAGNFAVGYAVNNATRYFIRLYTAQEDDTNYYFIQRNNDGTEQYSNSADGSAWTSIDQSSQINFRATTCADW